MDTEEKNIHIEQLEEFYWLLAKKLFKKHKPTKLKMLHFAGTKRFCLGFPCPYPLMDKDYNKCVGLGAHEESVGYEIYIRLLSLVFPEFFNDMNFFRVFGSDDKFWFLNLKYYEKKQRTIFEDFEFPFFDWRTYELLVHKVCKNFIAGINDEALIKDMDKQEKSLKKYIKKIMRIANDAVAYL